MPLPTRVHIGSLALDVGLVNGSGVVDVLNPDSDWNLADEVVSRFGAFVTKTTTLLPRSGHPSPVTAVFGSPGSLVNSVGLANPGIHRSVELWEQLPGRLQIPIIASLEGSVRDVSQLAEIADSSAAVAAIELNLSCPNVDDSLVAADARATHQVVSAARSVTKRPIIVKLTAACGIVKEVVRAAEAAGADAVCCGNTMPVIAVTAAGRPLLGSGKRAGLSGRDLHPIALRLVADAAQATSLPVIGLGGIATIDDIRRMQDVGASLFGVGTAAWRDPEVVGRLRAALAVPPARGHT
ncbi:MAG: pyrDB [Thermoleophilia bacterium]|nr:pyrDB [Thermoleophilia bacterium]